MERLFARDSDAKELQRPLMNKHLEKAEKLFQKGKIEGALEEYLLAWKDEPANDSIVYTVADLYQSLKRGKEAMECFNFLFEKAMERNDAQRAVELMRKMQVTGTVDAPKVLRLAQAIEKLRPDLSAEQYRRLMDTAGEKDPELKLECLQGLLRIQPSSQEITRRVAEAASKLGRREVARTSFQELADQMAAINKWPEAIAALDQVVRYDPADMAAQISLVKAYLKNDDPKSVLSLWEGEETSTESIEVARLLAEAFSKSGHPDKAEALTWRLAEKDPETSKALFEIAQGYFEQGDMQEFQAFVQRLEKSLGEDYASKEKLFLFEKLASLPHTSVPIFESIIRIMDRMNMDATLAAALSKLIGLYFAEGNFNGAADKLETLVAIDPYNPEASRLLEKLRGQIEDRKFQALSIRLGFAPAESGSNPSFHVDERTTPALSDSLAAESGMQPPSDRRAQEASPSSLKDLMLQAEIFLQYGMSDKARERLERIARTFPGEAERSDELRALFQRGGILNIPSPTAAPPVTTSADTPAETRDIRADLKKISEISRNLSRQGTIKAVISTAVNDLGRFLQVSRCVVGLAAPNRPPSMVMEYISPGIKHGHGVYLAGHQVLRWC